MHRIKCNYKGHGKFDECFIQDQQIQLNLCLGRLHIRLSLTEKKNDMLLNGNQLYRFRFVSALILGQCVNCLRVISWWRGDQIAKKAIYICFGVERGSHDRNACQLKKSRVGFLKDPSIANASDKPAGTTVSFPLLSGFQLPLFYFLLIYFIYHIIVENELQILQEKQKKEVSKRPNRNLHCEQRLHFRGMSWRAESSYFSHASSYHENVASARRLTETMGAYETLGLLELRAGAV